MLWLYFVMSVSINVDGLIDHHHHHHHHYHYHHQLECWQERGNSQRNGRPILYHQILARPMHTLRIERPYWIFEIWSLCHETSIFMPCCFHAKFHWHWLLSYCQKWFTIWRPSAMSNFKKKSHLVRWFVEF